MEIDKKIFWDSPVSEQSSSFDCPICLQEKSIDRDIIDSGVRFILDNRIDDPPAILTYNDECQSGEYHAPKIRFASKLLKGLLCRV